MEPGTDTYTPPKVLSLRLNRPETVPFTKINIDDDEPKFRNVVRQDAKDPANNIESPHIENKPVGEMNETGNNVDELGKETGDIESKEGHLEISSDSVKFKSASASDRGLRVVPIHKIKHQTAPLITEEEIKEQKILRQKYLVKKVRHTLSIQ